MAVSAPSGKYFTLQDVGSNDTIDSDVSPSTGRTASLSLTPNHSVSGVDAGVYQKGTISGLVWEDSNANGLRGTGDNGRASVPVELLNSSGTFISSTTSASDGSYQFANLVPGSYSVRLGTTTNLSVTLQDVGSDDTIDSDISPTTRSVALSVSSGQTVGYTDMGVYVPVTIQGKAWTDTDANGIRSMMEMGLSGVPVTLRKSDGTFVASATTDFSGNFSFSGVAPGQYYLDFDNPAGHANDYYFTSKDQGSDDSVDSDVDANGLTAYFTLLSGQSAALFDAGFVHV